MEDDVSKTSLRDLFVFETLQLVEQLEHLILNSEKSNGLESIINDVFRIMHTIKGSAAMMFYENIASLAHAIEDVFYFLRENKNQDVNYFELTDIVLSVIDFIKSEVEKVKNGQNSDGDCADLIAIIQKFLASLNESSVLTQEIAHTSNNNTSKYEAVIYFEEDCEMENMRAFSVIQDLGEIAEGIQYLPADIMENDGSAVVIRQEGFKILFTTAISIDKLRLFFDKIMFLKELKLNIVSERVCQEKKIKEINLDKPCIDTPEIKHQQDKNVSTTFTNQSFIGVNVTKLDVLLDLVGELVVSEAMVTQNPELKGLTLDNFYKASRHLKKIIKELQDVIMSIRMVPLSSTFFKMNRIVRDMNHKLSKKVKLNILGEDTEVDKNIIEHISDPLMHLIRNAIDHGIESSQDRLSKGKSEVGKITLEAKNAGREVWITVKDDGKGLNKELILDKARKKGLVHKADNELTNNEIFSLIFLPGFSTKEKVTEYSGRGVGMDVVAANIESVGGTISVDSIQDEGTAVCMKIPLTLAIIEGMVIKVGNSSYILPTINIKESFRVKEEQIIRDTDNNEMILIRGQCYSILRLHELYQVKSCVTNIQDGIMIMIEDGGRSICLFADALLGEQQVVVKNLPKYLKKVKGIAGCTLLGDGSISLILDISALIRMKT